MRLNLSLNIVLKPFWSFITIFYQPHIPLITSDKISVQPKSVPTSSHALATD